MVTEKSKHDFDFGNIYLDAIQNLKSSKFKNKIVPHSKITQ